MNISRRKRFRSSMFRFRFLTTAMFALFLAAPAFGQTGTSPWENAVRALQQAFTSTIARGLSLVAIVVAGLTFAFGEGGFPNAKESIAEKHGLPVGNGTIPVPELRIEYETPEVELRHVDLELATRDYRPRGLAEKASAGFSLYGRSEDASRLCRILDEQEITARILTL